jgi:hypothetical protein
VDVPFWNMGLLPEFLIEVLGSIVHPGMCVCVCVCVCVCTRMDVVTFKTKQTARSSGIPEGSGSFPEGPIYTYTHTLHITGPQLHFNLVVTARGRLVVYNSEVRLHTIRNKILLCSCVLLSARYRGCHV